MPLKITFINIISLLQAISVHDKGLALIKETQIFEKYMIPSSEIEYKKMAILVAQDTNDNWRNYHEMSSSLIDDSNQDLPATKSYNKFLVEVTEKLSQTEEYYLVKYELWKIRMTVSN